MDFHVIKPWGVAHILSTVDGEIVGSTMATLRETHGPNVDCLQHILVGEGAAALEVDRE